MEAKATGSVLSFFRDIPDPRSHNLRYSVSSLIVMALFAVISGADDWAMVAQYVRCKAARLRSFVDLPDEGLPSSHTFRRLFARLEPAAFESCFLAWMQTVVEVSGGETRGD
jgi:hypothetical protein